MAGEMIPWPVEGPWPVSTEGARDRSTLNVPRRLQATLRTIYDVAHEDGGSQLELRVHVRDVPLDVRGFAAYLAFTDRVYGRLTHGDIRRYARREDHHLLISEVRRGSLLLILRQALETATSPQGLILTGLVLKFLPDIIRAPATAYREYEQGRLLRAERKRLTERTSGDEELMGLERKDLTQLAAVLSKVYESERTRLAGAQSFAFRSVLRIQIRKREL